MRGVWHPPTAGNSGARSLGGHKSDGKTTAHQQLLSTGSLRNPLVALGNFKQLLNLLKDEKSVF